MNPAWLAVAATIIIALFTGGAVLIRTGRHAGKLEAVLEQLASITADHEARIRAVEEARRINRQNRSRP